MEHVHLIAHLGVWSTGGCSGGEERKKEAGGWGKLELPICVSVDANGTVLPTGQALQGEYLLLYPLGLRSGADPAVCRAAEIGSVLSECLMRKLQIKPW